MLQPLPAVLTFQAEGIGEEKLGGVSVPLTMSCLHVTEDGDEQRDLFVVKFFGDLDLGVKGLGHEIVAGVLAHTLGFCIPPMAVVEVSGALCEAAQATGWHDKICRSVGANFGSKLVSGEIRESKEIPDSHRGPAAELFAFDMLIQNYDRQASKCNVFQTKTGFILIDHEKSFLCGDPTKLLGPAPDPWDLRTLAPRDHVCYPVLKANEPNFDGFLENLTLLTDPIIDEVLSFVPDAWASPELPHIRSHLIKARDNAERLQQSLLGVLA